MIELIQVIYIATEQNNKLFDSDDSDNSDYEINRITTPVMLDVTTASSFHPNPLRPEKETSVKLDTGEDYIINMTYTKFKKLYFKEIEALSNVMMSMNKLNMEN